MGFFKIGSNDGDNFKNVKQAAANIKSDVAKEIKSVNNSNDENQTKNDVSKALKGIFDELSQLLPNEESLIDELEDLITKLVDVRNSKR